MGCFYYFMERYKYRKQSRSARTPSAATARSSTSNNITSGSVMSTSGNQTSKSTGSIASQRSILDLYEEKAHNLCVFELKELSGATNNFSRLLKIGEGGFGSVYKGTITSLDGSTDGMVVAIKKLNPNSLQVMGTYGYAAPDYIVTGHLTAKSDVWSFGVVLYEILTGRRSMDRNLPKGEQKLLEWVKQFSAESSRFSLIMDPRLENKYSLKAAREIAKLAGTCISKSAKDRPNMSEVVEALKQAMQYKELDGQVDPVEKESPPQPESNSIREQESGLASARRRMLHLAKMGETSNAAGHRRFVLMKYENQT